MFGSIQLQTMNAFAMVLSIEYIRQHTAIMSKTWGSMVSSVYLSSAAYQQLSISLQVEERKKAT